MTRLTGWCIDGYHGCASGQGSGSCGASGWDSALGPSAPVGSTLLWGTRRGRAHGLHGGSQEQATCTQFRAHWASSLSINRIICKLVRMLSHNDRSADCMRSRSRWVETYSVGNGGGVGRA
uniref:Uncharacterized protein n=1 Tax=Myotis myotis TaxID=51298 RepID=A0A7J7Y035_MYOMY|nr:hypothetical protein mMyoMyo1_011347 [Myotis myotis]